MRKVDKKDIFELETRRQIYHFILKYPGIHLRNLFRRLDLSESTIRHHVDYLKKRGLILKESKSGYSRFFVSNKFGVEEKKLLMVLRQDVPRNIILCLLVYTGVSQVELSIELGKDPKTISLHLKKLIDMGIIERASVKNGMICTSLKKSKTLNRTKKGREIIYRFRDPYLVYDLLVIYKDNLLDGSLCSDVLNYFEFTFLDKPVKRLRSTGSVIDRFIEAGFDIFPHPYHV